MIGHLDSHEHRGECPLSLDAVEVKDLAATPSVSFQECNDEDCEEETFKLTEAQPAAQAGSVVPGAPSGKTATFTSDTARNLYTVLGALRPARTSLIQI